MRQNAGCPSKIYREEYKMLVSSPQKVSLTQVAVMAQAARGRIVQIYLHWTAGRYGQVYDDYHLNIDADGTVYCTCA